MHSPRPKPKGSSSNASDLHAVFVRRVHQLVLLGYERLLPTTLVSEQEPAITGYLVDEIDKVLSERRNSWMTAFSVHDDPPVNDGRRKGKQRKRVDLRIDSGRFRPRARFRFEAKRLGKLHPVTIYLGAEGLGCFLRGDYAREEDTAGMIGYVQHGDLDDWSKKIKDELCRSPTEYKNDRQLQFSQHSFPSLPLLKTYRSKHHRAKIHRSIVLIHTLLKCH